jgi:tartrate-resistant acid phosphatase type 5
MKKIVFLAGIAMLPLLFSCKKDVVHQEETPPAEERPTTGYFEDVIATASNDTCLTFIFIGDWGYQSDSLVANSTQMAAVAEYLTLDFIVTGGDNFYESGVDSITDPVWDVYTENFNQNSLQVPWYVSVGNHDHLGSAQAQIDYSLIDDRWNFPSLFYTFSKAINSTGDSIGFVIIDTEYLRLYPDSLNQMNWIDSVTASMDQEWKIMVGHHPLFSYGYHGSNIVLQGLLENTLYDNSVDLLLSGHDHDMQHIKTPGYTDYFIGGSTGKIRPTSSGEYSLFASPHYGFLLLRVSKHKIENYFIDKNGSVVYQFTKMKA